jgi:hypothetical protein
MPQADIPQDHLTDYERAVCYFALPRLYNPVSFGLIAVFAFCLFEALCVIAYGTYTQSQTFIYAGVMAFIALVVFGIVVFLIRGLLNDVRTRRALAQAKGVPDAVDENLPNPFGDHVLLKHPINQQGKLFACTEDDMSIDYFVDSTPDQEWWKVTDSKDQEYFRVKAVGGIGSFVFNAGLPSALEVYVGDRVRATLFPRFTFGPPTVHISREITEPYQYIVRGNGIYYGDVLVGRVYALRNSLYLDIQKYHLNEATLAYFITLN